MPQLFKNAANGDWTGLRDFPIAAASLEKHMGAHFIDRSKLLSHHSAALYFGVTIPEPFRSQEINTSFAKAGNLLRISVGTSWEHLRYCPCCAREEFRTHRFSWWHRDHQLPFTSMCLLHECKLVLAQLLEMGTHFPHEVLERNIYPDVSISIPFELRIARYERYLASGNRSNEVHRTFQGVKAALAEISHDIFTQQEVACALVWNFLGSSRLREAIGDRDQLNRSMHVLLRDGFQYSDPVVVALLNLSMNVQSDFL
jgi:hypothetical protein